MQLRALLLLTFRELWAKKITLGLFIVCTLIWVMMTFALNLDIIDGSLAGIRIFGESNAPPGPITNPETDEVIQEAFTLDRFVVTAEAFVAGATYWAGIILGLFATASLVPNMLEPGRIDLMLSKPIGRTRLLFGHTLGIILTVFTLAAYLLGFVWLVLSIKTGIWHARFLLSIVLVVVMFAVMYSVVVLIGVTTRSAPLALIVSYGLIFASLIMAARDELAPQINPPWRQVFLGFYHVLPNFGEVTSTVTQLSGAEPVASWYPLVSSIAFGVVMFAVAVFFFRRRDF